MLAWDHGGGFILDASVRIEATDRAGLERLIRYCARQPFALHRLHLVCNRSNQILYLILSNSSFFRLAASWTRARVNRVAQLPSTHRCDGSMESA